MLGQNPNIYRNFFLGLPLQCIAMEQQKFCAFGQNQKTNFPTSFRICAWSAWTDGAQRQFITLSLLDGSQVEINHFITLPPLPPGQNAPCPKTDHVVIWVAIKEALAPPVRYSWLVISDYITKSQFLSHLIIPKHIGLHNFLKNDQDSGCFTEAIK